MFNMHEHTIQSLPTAAKHSWRRQPCTHDRSVLCIYLPAAQGFACQASARREQRLTHMVHHFHGNDQCNKWWQRARINTAVNMQSSDVTAVHLQVLRGSCMRVSTTQRKAYEQHASNIGMPVHGATLCYMNHSNASSTSGAGAVPSAPHGCNAGCSNL